MTISRKLAASAAALSLATGLVACSSDDAESTDGTSVVEETATEVDTATETADADATDAEGAEGADNTEDAEGAEGAEGDTTEIATADGESVMAPSGLAAAMDKYADDAWGEPVSVEETENGWIVSYDGEHYVTWNENTGGAPIWGEIANEWINGNHESVLGFPTEAETPLPNESGWIQEFEHGTIEWTRGEDGAFAPIINEA